MKHLIIAILIFGVIALLGWQARETYKMHQAPVKQTLANPASVYCAKHGGENVLFTLQNGAQDGLCQFDDNMACEEWAMMRGECPIGGIKTTGYDNVGQQYCAWLGGKTLAVPNSQCNLPDGKSCSTEDLYKGACGE